MDLGKYPLKLMSPHKVVYAPHYYSPSVYPQDYMVLNGTRNGDVLVGYREYDNATLDAIIAQSAQEMFGYLRNVQVRPLV